MAVSREKTVVVRADRCMVPDCRDDAVPGQFGCCSRHGQQIRRRIAKGLYTKEELIERGKILEPSIDRWLKK